MFGWDQSNINQNDAVTPLADMTFDQWWFHGYKDRKPAEGKFIDLVSAMAGFFGPTDRHDVETDGSGSSLAVVYSLLEERSMAKW